MLCYVVMVVVVVLAVVYIDESKDESLLFKLNLKQSNEGEVR